MELKTLYLVFMSLSAVTLLIALAAEYTILRQYRSWTFTRVKTLKALRHFSEVGLAFWAAAAVQVLSQETDTVLLGVKIAIAFFLVESSNVCNDKKGLKRFVAMLTDRSAVLAFAAYLTTLWLAPHLLLALWTDGPHSLIASSLIATLVVSLSALLISHIRSDQNLAQWEALC